MQTMLFRAALSTWSGRGNHCHYVLSFQEIPARRILSSNQTRISLQVYLSSFPSLEASRPTELVNSLLLLCLLDHLWCYHHHHLVNTTLNIINIIIILGKDLRERGDFELHYCDYTFSHHYLRMQKTDPIRTALLRWRNESKRREKNGSLGRLSTSVRLQTRGL